VAYGFMNMIIKRGYPFWKQLSGPA